jgi:chromosome segregation ATPase
MRIIERKIPWVEYAHYEALRLEAKEKVNETAAQLNEIAEIGAPQEQKIAQEETQLERCQARKKIVVDKARSLQRQLSSRKDELEALDETIRHYRKDIQTVHKRHRDRDEKMATLQHQIRGLETDLENALEIDMEAIEDKLVSRAYVRVRVRKREIIIHSLIQKHQVRHHLKQVAQQIQVLQGDMTTISEDSKKLQVRSTMMTDQLHHLESFKTRRIEYLKTRYRDLPVAVDWVHQNQSRFKNEVFEPICLLVSFLCNKVF